MNVKEIQLWLKNNGFDPGKIDGILGRQTKAAIQKAQQYLSSLNLYNGGIDGVAGNMTQAAMKLFDEGQRHFNNWGVHFNVYDSKSVANAFNKLKQQGHTNVKFGNKQVNLNDGNALNQFMDGAINLQKYSKKTQTKTAQNIAGNVSAKGNLLGQVYNATKAQAGQIKEKVDKGKDWWNNSFPAKLVRGEATSKAQTHEQSSYNPNDLDNLLFQYTYDVYHSTPIDNATWGIEYNYRPHFKAHTMLGLTSRDYAPTLKISSDKYTPEQAEQIARSAGMKTYEYGGKKKDVNLFNAGKGSQYANQKEFEAAIANAKATQGLEAAQNLYNTELARQYNNFGIDYKLLANKTDAQWNLRYGGTDYGYGPESMAAVFYGEQANDVGGVQGVGGLSSLKNDYQKLVNDSDYNSWYQSYNGLANDDYKTPIRGASVNLQGGFPLTNPKLRNQFAFVGAKPNANDIDYTNWYQMTDKERGSGKMTAPLFESVTKNNFKNVPVAYEYFKYLLTDENGNPREKSSYNEEILSKADQLAKAAGLPNYHRGGNYGAHFIEIPKGDPISNLTRSFMGGHDLYDSLLSFYQNAFDENGKLKPNFKYTENGYTNHVDSGNYTAFINKGQFHHAEDNWNVTPAGKKTTMSTNEGRGVPLINRNEKWNENGLPSYYSASLQIGGLLRYITRNK